MTDPSTTWPAHRPARTIATLGTPLPPPPRLVLSPEAGARITAAVNRMAEQLREALAPMAEALVTWVRKLSTLLERLRAQANDVVHVAGLEGKYYVRLGLDPAYRTAERRDALVQQLLSGQEPDGDLWLLTPENRARVAMSALRGWESTYGQGSPVLALHHRWGDDVVSVFWDGPTVRVLTEKAL